MPIVPVSESNYIPFIRSVARTRMYWRMSLRLDALSKTLPL